MSKHKRTEHNEPLPAPAASVADVEVERILPGGLGLAHAGGRTILVALAAPGDRVRVRIKEVRGRVAFASIEEIYEPSPVRVTPPCPYFGRCGGCDFQQLSYEAQLETKVDIIRDCLRRIARIEPPASLPITPAPARWAYRSRVEWQVDARQKQLGYFERGSRRICDVAVCPVAAPPLQETLTRLRRDLRSRSLPNNVSEFQAAAGDGEVSLAPPLTPGTDSDNTKLETSRTIGRTRYRFDARCFFQINHDLLEPLICEATGDAHTTTGGETALDLYCGVGLFTLPLARRFKHVVGVEANTTAARYAERNLADANLPNASIAAAPVGEWLRGRSANREGRTAVDFVLLDPPRTGVEDKVTDHLLALRPARIAYVSCDPATLARDLQHLIAGGYNLASVAAFDMFPQTHHVETVAHLTL